MSRSAMLLATGALIGAFVAGYVAAERGGRSPRRSQELPADLRASRIDPHSGREYAAGDARADVGSERRQAVATPPIERQAVERWMQPTQVSGWSVAAGAAGNAPTGEGGGGGVAGAPLEELASFAGTAGMAPLTSSAEGGAAPSTPTPPPSPSAVAQAEARLYGAGPGYTGVSAGWSRFTGAGAGDFGYTGIGAGDAGFTGIGAGRGFTGFGAGKGFTGFGAGTGFTGTGASPVPSAPPIVQWPPPPPRPR